MNSNMSLAERLAVDVIPEPMSGCHLWIGTVDRKGYGIFHHGGKRHRAHRVAYELKHGPLPAGMMACHKCDNPPCVNDAHLFAGTASDNAFDSSAKRRHTWARRDRCSNGHLFGSSVKRTKEGWTVRVCRVCQNGYNSSSYYRLLSTPAPAPSAKEGR